MKNKTLAYIGIGLYVLQVLSSASDDSGNSVAPTFLILLAGVGTLSFVVVAAKRLWTDAKYTALILVASTLVSAGSAVLLTPESSSINLVVNALKVVAFLSYFYVVFLLFAMSKKPSIDSNQK